MKFEHLAILLTCHSLEDFPVHHEGEDADSLLANWTALWHPHLIADANSIPTWLRTFEVPENCAGHLLLCPTTSDSELQTGFAQRVKEEGGRLIRRKTCRKEITSAIFTDGISDTVDPELTADFHALGYCYLQVQLLTRQLRYSSNLDEVYFGNLVVDAAKNAVEQQREVATQKLQSAFDLLMEERDNFYPVNALLLDLTLVAETTLGKNLENQLKRSDVYSNYLITGSIANLIKEQPSVKSLLSEAIADGKASLVGGTQTESRLPFLSFESVLDEFSRGSQSYQDALGLKVDFFGRRRYGLGTSLPQILQHFDFKGAFHFTLDDGRFPEGMQIKSFWEGDGEGRIEVFGKLPLDANSAGNFLNLGVKIGESFDMDHAAAICFVHWPGQTSVWYEDLKRICKFGSVLGNFVSTTQFLTEMEEPYQHDQFTADQYQSPFLKQAVIRNQPDPISKAMNYWRRTLMLDSIQALQFLHSIFSKSPPQAVEIKRHQLIEEFESNQASDPAFDAKLRDLRASAATRLIDAMASPDTESEKESTIVINTQSLVQRCAVEVPEEQLPALEKPVYAVSKLEQTDASAGHVVIDVPAMGYATISAPQRASGKSKSQTIADEFALRNEFVEIILDPGTGGIRAVHDYKTRGNRLSQVLAYRRKSTEEDSQYTYSTMKLDTLETIHDTPSIGVMKSTGTLVFEDDVIAEFTQRYTLHRGSRVLEVDVELENVEAPKSDPWNSYLGPRFAFSDESSLISTTINQSRQPISGNRIEAPHYIDLENLKARTSILTGGVPFHVRRGDRYIDSIYLVKNETCRKFRFGIGVDLPNPLFHAQQLISDPLTVATRKRLSPEFSWLFHFDTKNVCATFWSPVFESDELVGFRFRVLETMGRETKCKLSAFKEIKSATHIRFSGENVSQLNVEEGKAKLHLAANQFMEIEVRW